MNFKNTISVVIPVYNDEKSLKACLESLQGQICRPDEIVVVDNNSSDGSDSVARSFPNVRVVPEKRQGITYARTCGFNSAKYDIIARIDADSIASPSWVESILTHLENNQDTVALVGKTMTSELSPNGKFWFHIFPKISRKLSEIYTGKSPMLTGHNMAIRSSTWKKIAPHAHLGDNTINEDVDVSLFAHSLGKVSFEKNMIIKTPMKELYLNIPKLLRYQRTTKHTLDLHKSIEKI